MNEIRNPVAVSRRSDGRLEASVHAVVGWEGFDKLLEYLESTYEADVIRTVDGPDARRAWLVAGAIEFEVEYDDSVGSCLIAPNENAESFVREVANDLCRRLTGL